MIGWIEAIHALLAEDRYCEALEKCDGILTESPGDINALILKARILSYPVPGIGDPDKAVNLLENACAEHPAIAQLHEALGDVYSGGLGDYARASAEYARARELDPSNARIYYALAGLYQHPGVRMTNREAIAFLQKGISLEPQNWEMRRELATRLWEAGKLDAAEQEYAAALACEPGPDARSRGQIRRWLQKLKGGAKFSEGYRTIIS